MTTSSDLRAFVEGWGGNIADLPFWQACQEMHFLLHRCDTCGRHYWPASRCVEHGARAMQWVESRGKGEVYTYTVLHHAYTPDMRDRLPYAVAVVRLAEGPFFHSSLIDCPLEDVRVGLEVELGFVRHDSGWHIPTFHPIAAKEA